MSLFAELKRRNVIRIATLYVLAAWLLLQVADILFDAFEIPPAGMRLLVVVLLLGFVLAVIFAWVFELTPDGLRRESELGDAAGRQTTARKSNWLIAALAVLAIGFVVYDRIGPPPSDEAARDPSIAVLPFTNISDDPANEFFSDGLSEELLNLLAGIPELRVTARTSSFSFKDKNMDVRDIGQALNVANVLEGSVRRSGDQLRITAQLINVADGYHIWSKTYDRKEDDIFAIQDEISAAVVAALRVSLLGERPQAQATDPEAFAAYLQGLHFYQQRSSTGYAKTVEYLQQALDIDPEYAQAWILLASTYSNQALRGQVDRETAYQDALAAAERALQLDPNAANAYSARAWLAMTYEQDLAAAALYFRRATDIAPNNPVIMGNRAVLARTLGRIDTAIELTRQSLRLNPVSSTGYSNLSDQLTHAGKPIEAIAAAEKSVELSPGNATGQLNLAIAYLLAEQPERALEEAAKVDWPFYNRFVEVAAWSDLGRRAESDAMLAELIENYSDRRSLRIASLHAWRNEIDAAFAQLDRAVSTGQSVSAIRTDPFLRNLHDDERWDALLVRLGMSDEQLAAIRF
jgi:TolB-like protein/Flp pilus assembly protein TadD